MHVSRVAVMENLIPVFGVTLAVLLLGERLGLPQLGGVVLVLLAVVANQRSDVRANANAGLETRGTRDLPFAVAVGQT
jgi:drug/metabolite transporter (DMT)-like permease